jgi:hypothetical protein
MPQPLIHRRATNNSDNNPQELENGQEKAQSTSHAGTGPFRAASSDIHPAVVTLRQRLRGHGKTIPSVGRSIVNILIHSPLNVLAVFIPLSWVAHFLKHADGEPVFSYRAQFAREFACCLSLLDQLMGFSVVLGDYTA